MPLSDTTFSVAVDFLQHVSSPMRQRAFDTLWPLLKNHASNPNLEDNEMAQEFDAVSHALQYLEQTTKDMRALMSVYMHTVPCGIQACFMKKK